MYFYRQLENTLELVGVPLHYENLENMTTSKYGPRPAKRGSGNAATPAITANAIIGLHPSIFIRVGPEGSGMIALKKWSIPSEGWSSYRIDKNGKLVKW